LTAATRPIGVKGYVVDTRRNLHRARVARSIDLGRVSALTALSPAIVRKIDDGRYEELPGGVYARSYIRAFAEAVGIVPEQALREIEDLLPGAPDPLPTLREKATPSPSDWLLRQLSLPALAVRQVAQSVELSARMQRHAPSARRLLAAALDALILVSVGGTTAALTAWICGVGLGVLVAEAGLALGAMLAVPFVLYFVLFRGIAGRTPGATLCRLAPADESRELRLEMIAARAFRY
jgi:hypothetical protein